MVAQQPGKDERMLKASAHMCPQCGFSINLKDLRLTKVATGLVICPKCEWSESGNIQIVDGSRASSNRAAIREVAA